MFDIAEELKKMPTKSGVYIMKDENDHIIYIGKAIKLRNRVRSYFRETVDPKTRNLAAKITHFEYIVTDNELEALILECALIKKHSPKYNVRLKDSKAYPYIKVTDEVLPRILYVHQSDKNSLPSSKIASDGYEHIFRKHKKGRYFGPYISGERVRELLQLIHDIWPLRRCSKRFPKDFGKSRPCLCYHIGQCKAPCNYHISEEEYNKMVDEAISFIQGKVDSVVAQLTSKMQEYSDALEFEKATELRNLLGAINILTEKQKVENDSLDDRDIIALAQKDDKAMAQVFFIRMGKIIDREQFTIQNAVGEAADILSAFIKQFYSEVAFIPKELIMLQEPTDKATIELWLSKLKGRKVHIVIPQKGEKHKLATLAERNADLTLNQFGTHINREKDQTIATQKEIAHSLNLPNLFDGTITRIEAYDISNIQGFESVGSMVVFEDGKPKRSDYRKFKIKWVRGPDDYASMQEVITRRFNRYLQADENFSKKPDLIMIDGGKGQVSVTEKVLDSINLSIPVCGMIKDDKHRTRGLMYQNNEISLTTKGLRFITKIQDEVHRFAVEYHRKLRTKSQVHSILDDIPGIGPTRRTALIQHFKAIEKIRKASVEELMQADTMTIKAAESVYNFFRNT
ncbi:MAG: excinuclease ABC subunit UvrC [Turicibacter sp.]|nr:excinuclease ABC subunit UvrC [Turicibacter sp.]